MKNVSLRVRLIILMSVLPILLPAQPTFTVEKLTSPPSNGSQSTHVTGMAADGTVFGYTFQVGQGAQAGTIGTSQCWKQRNGVVTPLPTPGFSCWMTGVNRNGQFAGSFSLGSSPFPAYPWYNFDGTFVPMEAPGVTYPAVTYQGFTSINASATDVNDRGAVLGYVISGNSPSPLPQNARQIGFVYEDGKFRVLLNMNPSRMNSSGDVTGAACYGPTGGCTHAVIAAHDGTVTDLGLWPGGGNTAGIDINSRGQVTGSAVNGKTSYGTTAFFYDGSAMREIPITEVAGCDLTSAGNQGSSINDAGDVIGKCGQLGAIPFYYHAGHATDLNSLVVNPPAGLKLLSGFFVSKAGGQVIASGTLAGEKDPQWFVLTPAGESAVRPDDSRPVITGVVNGASFGSKISAGSWITIRGTNLAATTRQWTADDFAEDRLPTELAGVVVTVNGQRAYPAYVSPTQINVLAPDDPAIGEVPVLVTNSAGASSSFQVDKAVVDPAFFQWTAQYPSATHADGTLVAPADTMAGAVSSPALKGETIQLFGTGFGPTIPAQPAGTRVKAALRLATEVTVTIGGRPAEVTYAGMTDVGLVQLNVTIPADLDGSGDLPVQATVAGVKSPAGLFLNVAK